jgi:diketogulonate reductase-like aldo/keto reductase
MKLSLRSRYQLSDGNEIPVLGFGTYELAGENAYRAVKWALEVQVEPADAGVTLYSNGQIGRIPSHRLCRVV